MRIKVGICVSKSSTCHESVSSQLKNGDFFLLLVGGGLANATHFTFC